ncbi:hypothetical protein GCM10010254_72590 [Streptomyces chromofuscus]|nr:hypothetical protein GCM10010254_72590 [Streptomyces chromofuscus]
MRRASLVQIKLTPDGPRPVETNARPSGLPYYVADVNGEGQLEWSADAYVSPERFLDRAGTKYRRRSAFAWPHSPLPSRADLSGTAPWTKSGKWRVSTVSRRS